MRTSYRMRFSVQHGLQNAPFRRMRFSSPAQTPTRLTQKRILAVGPHGKPHSGPGASRKSALCLRHLTENRTLAVGPHAKAHSDPGTSRKTAFCPRRLTQRRILRACRHQRTRSVSPRRLPKTDATLARRSVTLARRGPTRRGEASDHSPAVGRRTPTPPISTPTPSVPIPAPRKHQVLSLRLGCIKRTFRFGKWRVAFTPISLPCPTQQRGKTSNKFVELRRKVKERCS